MQAHCGTSLFFIVLLCLAIESTFGQTRSGVNTRAVGVQMRNVMYHFTDQIVVHIFDLEGELIPIKETGIPVFDDNQSFRLAIDSAEIAISTNAMANVLNQNVFADKDSPLKGISISGEGDAIRIKGKLHSKGDIPFEAKGKLSVTLEGEIRIHAEKIKAAHLPVKGVMDLLGVKIASLINTSKIGGVRAEGNDLLLKPEQILPPPQIQGRVTDVQLRGNDIVQYFGDRHTASAPNGFRNYMAYRGAQLRFGKLTMSDTDLILIDMDPQDPFDFYLDRYKEQLVAGYTKTTPAFGLRVYMRDFNKLRLGDNRHKPPQSAIAR
jgi:hypothetical protein